MALRSKLLAWAGHQLDKWSLTLKKTLHASEQERQDVKAQRTQWKSNQPTLDAAKLVFLMRNRRQYAYGSASEAAQEGERCIASVPTGIGKPPRLLPLCA